MLRPGTAALRQPEQVPGFRARLQVRFEGRVRLHRAAPQTNGWTPRIGNFQPRPDWAPTRGKAPTTTVRPCAQPELTHGGSPSIPRSSRSSSRVSMEPSNTSMQLERSKPRLRKFPRRFRGSWLMCNCRAITLVRKASARVGQDLDQRGARPLRGFAPVTSALGANPNVTSHEQQTCRTHPARPR